ncbi:MAG TPA: hypothetical protein VMU94_11305 [Streptosporangiaceae bacterium]|nr:hypothetical protein [Streptosporangiaceae bacterium]
MPTSAELVSWAREHATKLEADMTFRPAFSPGSSGYWQAAGDDLGGESRIRARAITALDFLEHFAGAGSQWARGGHDILDKNVRSMETGARALGDVLREWANQVDAGIVVVPQAEAHGARAVAATDLMEQVRMLNEDKTVSPAAPIVLAGAALEIALRSAIAELSLQLPPKHSINAYMGCLRAAGVLSVQDVKDVEQMSGLRNSAAHGDFDALSRERAGLMEQQVGILLRRLAEIIEPRTATAVPDIAD